jgi:hypothetical protein
MDRIPENARIRENQERTAPIELLLEFPFPVLPATSKEQVPRTSCGETPDLSLRNAGKREILDHATILFTMRRDV